MPAPASAVLDTNVVLDWLVFRDPRAAPLAAALQGRRLRWLACAAMREELAHMLAHERLARWAPDAAAALACFDALAELPVATPPPVLLRCSDADDQIFVDLALAQGARWLLTHDRALLKLARRAAARGLAIVTPMRWADAAGAPPLNGTSPGT